MIQTKKKYAFVLGILVLGIIFLFDYALAEYNITSLPQKVNGIGIVQYYQTGKNTYVGVNLNLELLHIATVTGSGFIHPGYTIKNEIGEIIQSYYRPFQSNQYARQFNELSQKFAAIPQQNFPTDLTAKVLKYGQEFSTQQMSKADTMYASIDIEQALRCFYDETDSKRFWKENLSKYNEMTAKFIADYHFDYLSELEEFFGVSASKDKFEILLSPLYGGGSAVPVENPDKTMTYYCIINPYYSGYVTPNTIIHETAHNFLYPVLMKKHDLIAEYQKYLQQAFGKAQGFVADDYNSFINEFLARIISIAIADQSQNRDIAYQVWQHQKMQGWDHIDEVYALVKNRYLAQRERYPAFEDFLPVILEYFKAKGNGEAFDIGPKVFENTEIKVAKVVNVYWEGDSQIAELKVGKPHSFLLEVEFGPDRNPFSLDRISEFFHAAGFEFELVAEGIPQATARLYEGWIYQANGRSFWGFWAVVNAAQFKQLKPGVYKLVLQKPNKDYKWVIDENVRVTVKANY